MDYKEKYDKLVEAVKVLQETNPSDEGIQNWVNDNVPELRESEDERIRKRLIAMCQHYIECYAFDLYNLDGYKEALAWLEKQGEQKSAWSKEDERIYQSIIDDTVQENLLYNEQINWLKSLKQRYTWKPSEEQMKVLDEVLTFAANHENHYWNDYIFGTLNNLIRQLKKLKA